jgi:SNF2 family DNA or RNA helicase
MNQLILSSSTESKYILTGVVNLLLSNKRARSLLKVKLKITEEGERILIDSDEPIERVAHLLGLAAKYINAEIVYDNEIASDIKVFHTKELEFQEFGEKARLIKNNNCEISEFDAFTKSLESNMANRRLYPLQLLSAYHMAFSQNACNFSVPGAGKTSIVYGAYTYLKNLPESSNKRVDKILIIGPLSAFGPWESEYEACFGIPTSCKRINGALSSENRKQYFYGETAEVILISYASVVTIKESLKYYLKNNRVMVVLDEAHKIKNTNGGITATSIMELAPFCSARVILTGTPAPNGYEDLYNLFHFIWPNVDVPKYTTGQLRDMTRTQNDPRVPNLINNIDPYYIRIKKSDLNIPTPVEHDPIEVPMKDAQRRIYEFIEERFVSEIENRESDIHSILVRARTIRLQQVATNPILLRAPLSQFAEEAGVDFSTVEQEDSMIMSDVMRYYEDEIPAKYEACAQLINDITKDGGKVVVWAIFIKTIETLQSYLDSIGIKSRALYGATPIATDGMTEDDVNYELTRESIIKEFHNPNSQFKVIIANPFAVAESISLHKACHNAIYLERSFNCAHFVQSKDRIHRYGLSPDDVTNYYYLISQNTVDSTINERLHDKEARMIAIIESAPIPLFNNLNDDGDEDIKAIIRDYVKRKNRKIH